MKYNLLEQYFSSQIDNDNDNNDYNDIDNDDCNYNNINDN